MKVRAATTRRSLLAGSVALGAAGLFPAPVLAVQTTLRLGLADTEKHPATIAAIKFAELVGQRTKGSVQIEVFPNSQLGTQQDMVNGLQTGTVDFSLNSNAFNESIFPNTQVCDLPFAFKDTAAAERVLDGPVGLQLFAEMPAKGIVGLAWLTGGWRQMENNLHSILKPADLRGLKMRIQNGPVYVSMFKALGAIPVVIAASEAYTAFSQHTVDGMEVPTAALVENRFMEVVKYVSFTNHIYNSVPFLGSKAKLDALAVADRHAIESAAMEARLLNRRLVKEDEEKDVAALIRRGLVLTRNVDHAAFAAAMAPVYDEYRVKLKPGLVDAVLKGGA